jgi:hypothetical protein
VFAITIVTGFGGIAWMTNLTIAAVYQNTSNRSKDACAILLSHHINENVCARGRPMMQGYLGLA